MQSITLVRAASKKSVTSKRRSVARMVLALSMTFSASASWAIDLAQSWQLAMNNDPVYAAARANYVHGIVSIGDVVKQRLEEVQVEVEELQSYIRSS